MCQEANEPGYYDAVIGAAILIYVAMLLLIFVTAWAVSGCSAMPTMKYCDKVEYTRDGSKIRLVAECQAPVGGSLPSL